ncbi:MAG: GNAT family N-acetyltransferase [Actinomycetota bacterium]|nr:GNAT family N-acetyltransferase [Actinomycetota bacterium]
MAEPLQIRPLTPERWDDLVTLFGPRGAVAGCWCMWWRQTAREFEQNAGEANREALRALVDSGRVPGLLAYHDGRAVGWVSVAPRGEFGRLERSPTLGRVDETPVWSVVCFYVARDERRGGVGSALLRAAADHVSTHGGRCVEGYPVDVGDGRSRAGDIFTGVLSTFLEAGFQEVARRSPKRPIVRLDL